MKKASQYRSQARGALKGRYGLLVTVQLLTRLLTLLIGMVPYFLILGAGLGISQLLSEGVNNAALFLTMGAVPLVILSIGLTALLALMILASAFFSAGQLKIVLLTARRKNASIRDFFSGAGKWLCVKLAAAWLILGIIPLLVLAAGCTAIVILAALDAPGLMTGFAVFALVVLMILMLVFLSLSFGMTAYVLVDEPERGPFEALAISWKLMSGKRWKAFCLGMSFFGWLILGSLSMDIGMLWIVPYMQTAFGLFYLDLKAEREDREAMNLA